MAIFERVGRKSNVARIFDGVAVSDLARGIHFKLIAIGTGARVNPNGLGQCDTWIRFRLRSCGDGG